MRILRFSLSSDGKKLEVCLGCRGLYFGGYLGLCQTTAVVALFLGETGSRFRVLS